MPGPMSTPNSPKRPTLAEKVQRGMDLMKGKLPKSGKTAKVHGR
ncbi:hypothetical protein SEA_DAUBENSKI_162 [Streptomyces phage Daubenski]|uniref:Uncharacterized protein n=1 Tax=Streptomyces phage Daubenski TaxID=2653725 RepID=A0A5Q2WDD4_9CAUD|nr:hypothetical protein KNU80_gp131 [Streptomyces phage Daubenski]QGH76441.1 hypothetical protein SEA_DAUBENSKI_162 [Streptomyces phage Daubenski]